MAADFGVSEEEVSEGATDSPKNSPKNSLMLYYNRDNFLEMCSDGPNGRLINRTYGKGSSLTTVFYA